MNARSLIVAAFLDEYPMPDGVKPELKVLH